ncbi:transport ATP-binding protein CydD [Vibrio maritimus]|uniref:Transport ATP-binding protein CydD n=1 Tax=Vibrio maritimus TaxID=990268 RepID=A0A090S3G0_9VIBR|nr:transport ATP-binding protein CydD [Vibrio maritimus]
MDKKKQRSLNKWLKEQSKLAKRWLMIAIGLGVLSSLFLLAQAALIATILHQLIIEHVDKHELIPTLLDLLSPSQDVLPVLGGVRSRASNVANKFVFT